MHPSTPRPQRLLGLLLALLLGGAALAQAEPAGSAGPWTLTLATESAIANDPDLSSLRLDLEAAERDLRRATLDPLATGQERMAAEHAVAAAQSAIEAATVALRIEVLTAFTAVREAEDGLLAAAGAAEVAQREAEAAQLRLQAGAITEAALIQARSAAEAAQRQERDAAIDLGSAWNELANLLGATQQALQQQGLAALDDDLPALPDLEADLLLVAQQHASVRTAERGLLSAQAQLAAVDHEASAPNQVADARAAVDSAQRRLEDARRSAAQGLRSAHQGWLAAGERLADARLDLEVAGTTFEAQSVRYQLGELSPIAYRQAELSLAASQAALRSSLHAAHLAWLRYQQARIGS